MSKTSAATKRFMNEKLQGKDVYTEPNSAHSDQELLERKLRFSSQVVQDLSFWVPHVGQAPIGKALFYDEKKDVIVECGRKYGKDIALDQELPTPSGFVKMKDLNVGDYVFGDDGVPTKILWKSDIIESENFEITFCNGEKIIAGEGHNWSTLTKLDRKKIRRTDRGGNPGLRPSVKTTRQISESVMHGKEINHTIPVQSSVQYDKKLVSLDPYVMGYWLGNGCKYDGKITSPDEDIVNHISDFFPIRKIDKYDYYASGIVSCLKKHGLSGGVDKFIPDDFLFSDIEDRKKLLAGLLDSDGHCSKNNLIEFSQSNALLFNQFTILLSSLGIKFQKTTSRIGKYNGINCKENWRCFFQCEWNPFFGTRKRKQYDDSLKKDYKNFYHHKIVKVESVGIGYGQCISVDNESHLFLVSKSYIPTHNSELAPYCQYRWAITHNDSYNYYFVPMKDQIGDIIWSNGRMPEFLPIHLKRKYLDGDPSKSEYRVNFKNGSFIRCDGSDSHQKARGYSANGLTVYDETKDFHPMFHDAFDPNRAINDAPLLALGTPGDEKALLTKLFDAAQTSSYGAAFNFPSYVNPHISKEFLAKKEKEYRERGEYDLFQIEYLAKRIKLGSKYIFPMLKRAFIKPHAELLKHVNQNRRDYDFCVSYDPGSSKCFAVLLLAIHRFERHVIILDEIYATKLGENSTRKIVPVALFKAEEINPVNEDWMDCYDYAAAWFHSDIVDQFEDYPHALFPCEKDIKDKEAKLNLIKDMLNANLISVSDRCTSFYKEMDEYKLNDKGILKKENDHLIDAFRYALNVLSYDTIEAARPLEFKDKYKTGTPELDLLRSKKEGDFYGDIDGDLFY